MTRVFESIENRKSLARPALIAPGMIAAVAWVPLILILFGAGAVLGAATVLLMARMLLRPPRMTAGRAMALLDRLSPGDLGLAFEEMEFRVRDQRTGAMLRLPAWWIPAAQHSARTAILLHGYGDSRIGAIAWAPLFHDLGFNILAPDLRAHGEADGDSSTGGYFERHDLNQLIDELRLRHPAQVRQLLLFGVSLGAGVVLAALAQRDDIAAAILEGPYTSYRDAIRAHAPILGAPGGLLQQATIALASLWSGADFDAVRPIVLLAQAKCPLMIIHAGGDPFLLPGTGERLRAALAQRSNPRDIYWEVPNNPGHVLGFAACPDEYRRRIAAFVDSALTLS